MRDERTGKEITPALFPLPFGIGLMVVLVVLTVLGFVFDWAARGTIAGAAIVWFVVFVLGTTYAFHKARQAGEWPPPDRQDR